MMLTRCTLEQRIVRHHLMPALAVELISATAFLQLAFAATAIMIG